MTRYCFLILLLLTWPVIVAAHTHLEKSSPAQDEQLTGSPDTVDLWFSGKVDAQWSKIEVTDAAGNRVDSGEVSSGGDPKYLSVELQSLTPGSYRVEWSTVSGDGHRVKGSYSFEVK